jgi:hypothetical protein
LVGFAAGVEVGNANLNPFAGTKRVVRRGEKAKRRFEEQGKSNDDADA